MGSETLADPRAINPTVSPGMWTALRLLLSVEPEGRPRTAGHVGHSWGWARDLAVVSDLLRATAEHFRLSGGVQEPG